MGAFVYLSMNKAFLHGLLRDDNDMDLTATFALYFVKNESKHVSHKENLAGSGR